MSTDPTYFDEHRWLNDLLLAAEGFRVAMVRTGALSRIEPDKYRSQYDALINALCPFNYRRHVTVLNLSDGEQERTTDMIELRWVVFGPNRQLEYRTRETCFDNWGGVRYVGGWTDWKIVPDVDGNEAALGDLIASGGIVDAP